MVGVPGALVPISLGILLIAHNIAQAEVGQCDYSLALNGFD